MRHSPIYMLLSRFSSLVMAFSAVSFLVFFGAENGLASLTVRGMTLNYRPKVGSSYSSGYTLYYYFLQGTSHPTVYEIWPFLQDLRSTYQQANGLHTWFPYGYLEPGYGRDPPYIYQRFDTYFDAGTVPDDWIQQDVDLLLNESFNALTPAQKAAITGTFVSGVSNGDKFAVFNTKTIGTITNGGVVTYDSNGDISVSYPDNTGYISGNKLQPDGSTTPVYYTIENNQAVVHDTIPVVNYSSLQYDSDLSRYTLEVPNYSRQLDSIINKMDNIKLEVAVNPEIAVNPSVTVEPEIILNPILSVTNSVVLSSGVEDALFVDSDLTPSNLSTNDFVLTQDEETAVSALRNWETNIPLIGESIDFGLTILLGRIPSIGTEYVWMDHTVGSNSRSSALPTFRIFISLERYREVILALRGFLILFEALLFLVMTYRNIREALKV